MHLDNPKSSYEGIPVSLRFSDIDTELASYPTEKQAVDLAKIKGWKEALDTIYGQGMVSYSSDEVRTKFLELLPLNKGSTALEIGIGFGQHTAAIATSVKHLDTLEVRLLNAAFTKMRCQQLGISNVSFFCGGDDCTLPFSDNSYDVVILNLVLEWCGNNNISLPARKSQLRLLSEINRVLKPSGYLQISTKNRYAYRLLLGGRDEHCHQIRFGSALPRWLLRVLLTLFKKGPPPGYLQSYLSLKRLLKTVGFTAIRSFWAVPEMRFAEHFIPSDPISIRAARPNLPRQGETRATELLMRATPAFAVRHFAPGLFFIAQKLENTSVREFK